MGKDSINNIRKIDRFCKYMEYKGINDNQVTVSLGLSVGIIGKSKAKGRDLSAKTIEKILNFYTDLNGDWLIAGVGDMLKQPINVTVSKNDVIQLIELLKKKDEQIDRLLTLLEKK